MKSKAIVLVIGVLFLLGVSHEIGRCGVDPGVPDTIRIDYISQGFGPNNQLVVTVTIYNDDTVGAIQIPLGFYNENNLDIVCDSVSFAGGRADYFEYFKDGIINWNGISHTVVIGVVPLFVKWDGLNPGELAHPMYPGETRDLLAKIYFTTGPTWKRDVEVVLDTFSNPRGGMRLLFSSRLGSTYVPVFVNHRDGLVAKLLGVDEVPGAEVPKEFGLSQNYPNPFNPETNIEFSLDKESGVKIVVYNTLGQRVKILVDEKGLRPGVYTTSWNSTNENGDPVASGVYFYRIVAGEKVFTKKMILLR